MSEKWRDELRGPWGWTYDGSSDYSIGPADDPQVNPVAHVRSRDPVRGAALCALIATAPDLLASLRVAAPAYCSLCCPSVFTSLDQQRHVPECDAMRAAIAKAEKYES